MLRYLFALLVLFACAATAAESVRASAGHVVLNWTSPNHGYSISYWRNSLGIVSESSDSGEDRLMLSGLEGELVIQTGSGPVPDDECALAALRTIERSGDPVVNASGAVTIEAVGTDGASTLRASCVTAPDASYQIAFTRSAPTDRFGQFEVAARAVVESFRPGVPPSAGTPTAETGTAGLIEVAPGEVDPDVDPPADSNLVNHPTRFFEVEISFTNRSDQPVTIDAERIVIPGIGTALEHLWFTGGEAMNVREVTIAAGDSVPGWFLFAVPQTHTHALFCFAHVTNNDCTFLFDLEFSSSGSEPALTGASPAEPLALDPGR